MLLLDGDRWSSMTTWCCTHAEYHALHRFDVPVSTVLLRHRLVSYQIVPPYFTPFAYKQHAVDGFTIPVLLLRSPVSIAFGNSLRKLRLLGPLLLPVVLEVVTGRSRHDHHGIPPTRCTNYRLSRVPTCCRLRRRHDLNCHQHGGIWASCSSTRCAHIRGLARRTQLLFCWWHVRKWRCCRHHRYTLSFPGSDFLSCRGLPLCSTLSSLLQGTMAPE